MIGWPMMRDRVLHVVFDLVDGLHRNVMGRSHLPPWSLRYYVGAPHDFESIGAEFMVYLKLLLRLRPDERLLDIGCGCGMMALQLRGYLSQTGRYVGMDISRRAIDWCQRHITPTCPNYHFVHADIRNPRYNPIGSMLPEAYRFPFSDGEFDLVLLKSVFTHMRPAEAAHYLREIARLSSPSGRCLATFFLLNPEQAARAASGLNRIDFRFSGEGEYRYAYPEMPERAIAYPEDALRTWAASSGLKVEEVYFGTWSGRPDGLSYQDLVVFKTV